MLHKALAGALCATLISAPALADSLVYTNERFGTRFALPAHMFDEIAPAPANSDGITLAAAGATDREREAVLSVYGRLNSLGETAGQMLDRLESDRRQAGDTVTYSASGESWLVLSGYSGGKIYYERHELAGDRVHAAIVLYPEERSGLYEPFVEEFARRLSGQ